MKCIQILQELTVQKDMHQMFASSRERYSNSQL